ncbi:putative mitochondrial hypothetical protein [Leptomonas pyrrhocoris]|uniref:Uncharacterized protein n=1 Tax=Leptomonas pyrrhocoris TaxID=157538 RepID=A0A0M9G3H6_LEPPY|nr:putative mitochondrial hypothetical protein [Leptomonas pyrrhocoris]XP_015660044.1 putative mitochondrial hypothetical protein [Leptomonas pyrrhocoris]KPA81604.1 putative mitochondrial hypothetical protein [Leptomonas pyrrhocoris]KPA81605.1 putative mitochondrial hypothetical protein [Leptomonas pyrrhocoris]|eukprot:XP_015660043.1 putative mitochondrial hypothetical protein [Leptomonas pyrrhocoris]
MRRRGNSEPKTSAHPSITAAAAASAAARAAAKQPSTRQSRRRGFCIATGCFLFCLIVYVCLKGFSATSALPANSVRTTKPGLRVTERDVVALGLATQQVADLATLPGFDELSKIEAQLGAVYLMLLEQVAAAEELEDGGHALRQLDVSQHYLSSVADALRRAADVSYTKLKRMLLRELNAELAMAPTSLVRTMYGWMLSDLFLYCAVLPEYYLLKDDTAAHAVVLLRSVNLLSWSSLVHTGTNPELVDVQLASGASLASYDIFNWSSGAACRKSPLGALSPKWMQFCGTSFSSTAAVARRTAATYEELIVLHPDYAPLRLHYAVAFSFLGAGETAGARGDDGADAAAGGAFSSWSDHARKALGVVRNDREKVGVRYEQADGVHLLVLTLLEAYLTPADEWTSEQNAQLVHALGELKSCERVRMSLLAPTGWSGSAFQQEYRVPILTPEQVSALLAKAQVHLGAGHSALTPFHACL